MGMQRLKITRPEIVLILESGISASDWFGLFIKRHSHISNPHLPARAVAAKHAPF